MVDHFDYLRVRKWMKESFRFDDWFDDVWYNIREGTVRFINVLGMQIQISGRRGGCGRCRVCKAFFGGICIVIATILLLFVIEHGYYRLYRSLCSH